MDHCLIICSEMESSRLKLFHALAKSQAETRMLVPEALTPGKLDSLNLSTCYQILPRSAYSWTLDSLFHVPDNSCRHSLLLLCNADCSPRMPTAVCAHVPSILCPAFLAAFSPSLVVAFQWLSSPGSSQFILSSMV